MKKSYDVVIAGGGVIGAAIAYFLGRDGDLSVAMVDLKKPGNASRASAGGLWPIGESVGLGCGVIFFKTLSKRRAESKTCEDSAPLRPHQLPPFFFDFCLRSNEMFPALWRELKEEHRVDFKLEKTGLKFVMYDEYDRQYAQQIADSIPHLQDQLQWDSADELRASEPWVTREAIGALTFLRDDQVNPYLLIRAFRDGARRLGVDVLQQTEVVAVRRQGRRIQGVETTEGFLGCNTLINAAGAWASDISRMAISRDLPVRPVKGQILLSSRLPPVLGACLSTSDCYIAQKDNGEILIGSTTEEEGFDTTCTLSAMRELSTGAVRCLPPLKNVSIKRTWAGLRPGTPDEIPILGAVEGTDGYLNACGHFRTGILTSAITGEILRALVRGIDPPIPLEPFLLSRFDQASVQAVQSSPSEGIQAAL